jgi:hypothetical protein
LVQALPGVAIMVSIGPFSTPLSQTQLKGPPDDGFGLPGSTEKGLAGQGLARQGPAGADSHLAFVQPERGASPSLFRGALNLLEAGFRGAGALAGYIVGTGAQLLEQLLSNPTADKRELVGIIRDLQARGLNIDSAVGLRELPNGDIGVYDLSDPDDPFPPLLAVIKQDGSIVLPAQDERPDTTGPTRPLIPRDFNAFPGIPAPGRPPSGAEQERPPSSGGNSFEDTSFPPPQLSFPEVPPTDPNRLSLEAQARIDALNAQRQEIKERDAKFQDQSDRLDDEIGQMEAEQRRLAEQGRLKLGAQNTLRDLERAISGGVDTMVGAALSNPQHIEALVNAVAGKVDRLRAEGEDEKALALIEAFLERYPDFNSDTTGAPELPGSRPLHGGSAQNDDAAQRLMEALEAARRVILDPGGFFGDGVDPREEMYRQYGYIGLFAYDVVQAQTSPEGGSGGASATAGASTRVANYLSVLPAEIAAAIVNHLAGRLDAVPEMYRDALARALEKGDPEDPEIERARTQLENARETDQGQGPEGIAGADGTTQVNLGQNEALREQILEELGHVANIDQFSDGLDQQTIQRAYIAGQINAAIRRDPNSVIAVLGPDGNVQGVGNFSLGETEDGKPAIHVENILALESGHNVGLKLLQAIYDLGPGIMKLLSLTPELDDYYTARGGQNLGCPPGPGDSCSRFRWDERPDMVEGGEEDTPSTQPSTGASADMQGYDSKLNMPEAFRQTSEAGAPVNTHVFGSDPALDARTIEALDRLIALGESGVPLDPRTEAAAMIADQIRKNLDTIDHALVMTDEQGRPVGMVVYTYYPNPDDPTGPRVLFIEDIVSFVPGQGIGLKLLQEAFDRSEGILELISLPGALEYYMGLGAEIVPPNADSPFAANLYPHLRWTDRPERQEP